MWDELYEAHFPELKRYASAACRSEAEGEDAAQEVFLRAMQNGDVFLDLSPSQRRAWLYRALKNLLCDRYRRVQLEMAYLEKAKGEEAYLDPGIQEAENLLLLEKLDPQDRALFCLRHQEGYNATELSQMFGIPPGTVRARLSLIRKQLKIMLLETGGNQYG